MDYDVVIIGAGPAGLTAAIYASRANLRVAILEKLAPGGKVITTAHIENWPGDDFVEGPDLSIRMYNHALKFGAIHVPGECTRIDQNGDSYTISYVNADGPHMISARAAVIATGMINRVPEEVVGIREYENRGVSYCVVCDGNLYKDMPSAVIGDGNSAVEEATYLSAIASKVYVLSWGDRLKAEPILIEKLINRPNVEVLYNARALSIEGTQEGIHALLVDINGTRTRLEVNSIFPYIGFIPAANFAAHLDIFSPNGFIITNENMQTTLKGLYAVGDIRVKDIRQITTAAADGTIAGKVLANELN